MSESLLTDIFELKPIAAEKSLAEFVELFTSPALTFYLESSPAVSVESGYQHTMDTNTGEDSPMKHALRNRLAWVRKASGTLFGNIVSLGRAPLNDICLPFNTISKIHCVFMLVGEDWQLVDRGSRNGVYVNGERVSMNGKSELHDGDVLHFGKKLEATFHCPKGLYAFLRGAQGD